MLRETCAMFPPAQVGPLPSTATTLVLGKAKRGTFVKGSDLDWWVNGLACRLALRLPIDPWPLSSV